MKINVSKPKALTIYPDIEGNAELPQEQRFAIELVRPSQMALAEATSRMTIVNGQVENEYNLRGTIKAHVRKLVNPPTLVVDGKERAMALNDVFEYDELSEIREAINDGIQQLRAQEGDDSPKN